MSKIMFTSDLDDNDVSHDKPRYITPINSNDIYFYNDVSSESTFILNKSLLDLSRHLLITQITYNLTQTPHINLHINSDGGEVFSALSTVDRIRSSNVPIHSHVEGLVASAATLISVSCQKRYVRRHSIMLVHQLRSWFGGTYENFKDESKNLDTITNIIKSIYLKHTKFTDGELDDILKRDIYLDANDAIKYGLADEII